MKFSYCTSFILQLGFWWYRQFHTTALKLNCGNIYILRLKDDKYYVGKADNVGDRFMLHLKGNVLFTKKYPPEEIVYTCPRLFPSQENLFTLQMMSIFGIDKVRGGNFCQLEIDHSVIEEKMKFYSTGCFHCQQKSHLFYQCPHVKSTKISDDTLHSYINQFISLNQKQLDAVTSDSAVTTLKATEINIDDSAISIDSADVSAAASVARFRRVSVCKDGSVKTCYVLMTDAE